MITKKEWENYFEAINGREPTPMELEEALLNNEFKLGWFVNSQQLIVILLCLSIVGITWLVLQVSVKTNESSDVATETFYSKESTSANETPKTETTSTTMNIDELASSNFSSVAGKWKNKYGTSFEIDESGYIYFDNFSTSSPINDIDSTSDGYSSGIMGEGKTHNNANMGDYIFFIPAGITPNLPMESKDSDSSKDRIAIGNQVDRFNDPQVYYRIEE